MKFGNINCELRFSPETGDNYEGSITNYG